MHVQVMGNMTRFFTDILQAAALLPGTGPVIYIFGLVWLSALLKMEQVAVCPVCGSRGSCVPHGSYRCCVADYICRKVVFTSVRGRRVTDCGHTHAVLPNFTVPYTTYSLFFILQVTSAYFRRSPMGQSCRCFAVIPSIPYQWKALFLVHKEIWLGGKIRGDCP